MTESPSRSPMGGSGIRSPLGGLQKLSDELRQERQKATNALQDRARLKIEVQTLKSRMEVLVKESNDRRDATESADAEKRGLRSKIAELEGVIEQDKSDIETLTADLYESNRRIEEERNVAESLKVQSQDFSDQIKTKLQQCDSYEARMADAQSMIGQLQAEVERSRRMTAASENKYETSSSIIREQARQIAQLQATAEQTELLRSEYSKISASDSQLRLDLQESVAKNVSLTNQMHDAVAKANAEANRTADLSSRIVELENERDLLQRTVAESAAALSEMERRLGAEAQVAETASSRAELAVQMRESLESQLEDVKFAHESVLEARNRVERDFNKAVGDLETERRELAQTKEQKMELEKMLSEYESNQTLAVEVEFLRGQLGQLRQQQAQRDLDTEAGELAPKAILEREEQSRKMFEGIIFELRTELDRNVEAHQRTIEKLDEASRKAALVDQYEQEMKMYRDAAKISAMESHSASASASEAAGRTERLSHEKETTTRKLRQVEAELVAARAQATRLKEEIATERSNSRQRHVEKLEAERKVAELVAARSRLDTEMDGVRHENGTIRSEVALLKARMKEMEESASLVSSRMHETLIERDKLSQVESKLKEHERTGKAREGQLQAEMRTFQGKYETLQREYTALQNTTHSLRVSLDDANTVIDGLKIELDSRMQEKEAQLHEAKQLASSRAEAQIQGLREDLESTVRSWRDSEQVRHDKDEAMAHVRRELARERERGNLLKSQTVLLEERLRTNIQELSVYRSLDMYRSGMNCELGGSLPVTGDGACDTKFGSSGHGAGHFSGAPASRRRPVLHNEVGSAAAAVASVTDEVVRGGMEEVEEEGGAEGGVISPPPPPSTAMAESSQGDVKFSLKDLSSADTPDVVEPERGPLGPAAAARRLAENGRGYGRGAVDSNRPRRGVQSFGLGSRLESSSGAGGKSSTTKSGMPSKLDFDKARRMMQGGRRESPRYTSYSKSELWAMDCLYRIVFEEYDVQLVTYEVFTNRVRTPDASVSY